MKYAKFSDDFLSYFRLNDNGETLVLTDKLGCTRAVKLLPYEERPQGEWEEVGDNQPYSKDKLYGCSKCGFGGYLLSDTKNVNFCPNCGADMRKGDAE